MKSPLTKNIYGRLFGNIRHSRSSYIQNEFFLSRSFLKFDDDSDGTRAHDLFGGSTMATHNYNNNIKMEPTQYIFKGKLSRKMCGDWNAKLKLLRYETQGTVLGVSAEPKKPLRLLSYKNLYLF